MFQELTLRIVAVSLVGASLVTVHRCESAEPPESPTVAVAQSTYERPKTSSIDDALRLALADVSKALGELRDLQAQGEMTPHRPAGAVPFWTDHLASSNVDFSAVFHADTKTIEHFSKGVFTDDTRKHLIRALSYTLFFESSGRVQSYVRQDGQVDLSFYPDGKPEAFRADIGDHATGQVAWDANGKLEGERLSSHPLRSEKGLPELEAQLRQGTDPQKWQAVQSMAEIGAPAIPYALRVLRDGDDRSRDQAAFMLGLLRERGAPAVIDLAQLLKEEKNAAVRRTIAASLGMIGYAAEEATPALEEAVAKDTPEVAEAARFSLMEIQRSKLLKQREQSQ